MTGHSSASAISDRPYEAAAESEARLKSAEARAGWVEPDVVPLP
jgi:hypothetical protein